VDILAHTLWAGARVALASRRWPITPRTAILTMLLAALPDVSHPLPIIGWTLLGDGSFPTVPAYAVAVPRQEPWIPPLIELWSQHAHCVLHSAVVAGAVTLLLWTIRQTLWVPLLGWWSHIVIDVFSHSVDTTRPGAMPNHAARIRRPCLEHAVVPGAELRRARHRRLVALEVSQQRSQRLSHALDAGRAARVR